MKCFMIHYNGHSVFVKTRKFFEQQAKESPTWDTSHWHSVWAEGIEHARLIGEKMVRDGKLTRETKAQLYSPIR